MAIIAPAACSNRFRRGGGASGSVVAETVADIISNVGGDEET
jgi:hypothetical protein